MATGTSSHLTTHSETLLKYLALVSLDAHQYFSSIHLNCPVKDDGAFSYIALFDSYETLFKTLAISLASGSDSFGLLLIILVTVESSAKF